MMPAKRITKRFVDAVTATAKTAVYRDKDVTGFLLIVTPAGHKKYAVEYRTRKGRSAPKRRVTLGKHGSPWTPETARTRAKELLSEVLRGRDPLAIQYEASSSIKLKDLCDLYLEEGAAHKKDTTLRGDESRIRHYLKPRLGEQPISAIKRGDVERLVRDVSRLPFKDGKRIAFNHGKRIITGGTGAAGQCLAVLSAMYTFAKKRGLCTDNPAQGVIKPQVRSFERFLSEAEIGSLSAALDAEAAESSNPYPSAAIMLLLLTGCRKSEIIDLHWRDVDDRNNCLRLRDSKTGPKTVYLNNQAMEILRTLPRIKGNPYVIVGRKIDSGRGGIDRAWSRVRTKAGLRDVRLHDLRHSFASIAVKRGLSLHVVGTLLGHKHPSTTMRYAHLAAQTLKEAAASVGADIDAARQS